MLFFLTVLFTGALFSYAKLLELLPKDSYFYDLTHAYSPIRKFKARTNFKKLNHVSISSGQVHNSPHHHLLWSLLLLLKTTRGIFKDSKFQYICGNSTLILISSISSVSQPIQFPT